LWWGQEANGQTPSEKTGKTVEIQVLMESLPTAVKVVKDIRIAATPTAAQRVSGVPGVTQAVGTY
jgi:hypothetical protein